jgi:hypothetical protein
LSVLFLLLWSIALNAAEKIFDFNDLKPDTTPAAFRSVIGGQGALGEWKILLDELPSSFPSLSGKAPPTNRRPVLAQLSRDRTDEHTPMFIFDGDVFGDFKISTLFKLVEGEVEQMAGIAFGFQDSNNFYYVRASGLGKSFYYFKMINGQRSPPTGSRIEIPKGVWHEMTVECKGDTLRASLDGKELVVAREQIPFARGKIGFWTKSDSVSYFADTRVTYTPRENLAQVLIRDALRNYPRLQALHIFAPRVSGNEPTLIASSEANEIGKPAPPEVRDVLARSIPYHGKDRDIVIITLPLRDRNGENVAAIKVVMKSFPGQTEKNALARAQPIAQRIEARFQTLKDLVE